MYEVTRTHDSSKFGDNQFQHNAASFSDALAALSQEQQEAYMLCLEYSFLAHVQRRSFSWTDVSALQMGEKLTGWSDMHCRISQLQDRLHFHHEILDCFIDPHRRAECCCFA